MQRDVRSECMKVGAHGRCRGMQCLMRVRGKGYDRMMGGPRSMSMGRLFS